MEAMLEMFEEILELMFSDTLEEMFKEIFSRAELSDNTL